MDIPRGDTSSPQFPSGIGFWNVGFGGGRKTVETEKKTHSAGTRTKTNSTHI